MFPNTPTSTIIIAIVLSVIFPPAGITIFIVLLLSDNGHKKDKNV